MKRNLGKLFMVSTISALILLSGCEIPSPNSSEPVPVESNPIVVPVDPLPADNAGNNEEANAAADGATDEQVVDETANPDPNADAAAVEGDGSGDATAADAAAGEGDAAAETGGEEQAVDESPRPAEEEAVQAPAIESPPENGLYVIQAGDTLGQIAERFGLTTDELAAANGIFNINAISVGQEIRIPTPGEAIEAPAVDAAEGEAPASAETVYVVRAGDTFFSIAQRYGFTVEELQTFNGIADPTRIDVGQEIRIPAQ